MAAGVTRPVNPADSLAGLQLVGAALKIVPASVALPPMTAAAPVSEQLAPPDSSHSPASCQMDLELVKQVAIRCTAIVAEAAVPVQPLLGIESITVWWAEHGSGSGQRSSVGPL